MGIILVKQPKQKPRPPRERFMTFCPKYKPTMQACGFGPYTAAAPTAETL